MAAATVAAMPAAKLTLTNGSTIRRRAIPAIRVATTTRKLATAADRCSKASEACGDTAAIADLSVARDVNQAAKLAVDAAIQVATAAAQAVETAAAQVMETAAAQVMETAAAQAVAVEMVVAQVAVVVRMHRTRPWAIRWNTTLILLRRCRCHIDRCMHRTSFRRDRQSSLTSHSGPSRSSAPKQRLQPAQHGCTSSHVLR